MVRFQVRNIQIKWRGCNIMTIYSNLIMGSKENTMIVVDIIRRKKKELKKRPRQDWRNYGRRRT